MSDWDTTTDRELEKSKKTTVKKLKKADDLLDFTLKEQKDMFGSGNVGIIEGGLCDGQKCIDHVVKPYGIRGCACRRARPDRPDGEYYRDQHAIRCTQNGQNEVTEFGCKGFKSDPHKQLDRKKPAYMKRVYARRVI